MSLTLSWNKCEGDKWCDLLTVNLGHEHFEGMEGVYVIWHGGSNPATVRVGQGVIKDRLEDHRSDKEVLDYQNLNLFVTWASVPISQRDGVENYLSDQLKPKVGSKFPDATPIQVNLPW